ncbi:MAG: sce7726 family protein [Lachnospiraceae bacterium]|nr:sce7726 family protein [Lachnospiraceae bacterium]
MERIHDYMLNKIFTIPNIDKMIWENNTELLLDYSKAFVDLNDKTYGTAISTVYNHMDSAYRNEYFYKNAIFNQLLLKKHSLTDTVALTELPISDSKADFVMINGKGVVYEIKTDLDNFNRLKNQIEDYYKAFPYVNVVVGYKNYSKAKELLSDTSVGIFVLYNTGNLICRKKALYNDKNLSYETMFEILRKKEFESIILKHYKKLPEVNSFLYYRECLNWIKNMSKKTVHNEMLICLKKRMFSENKLIIENKIPYELKFYSYFSKRYDCDVIGKFWEKRIEV